MKGEEEGTGSYGYAAHCSLKGVWHGIARETCAV